MLPILYQQGDFILASWHLFFVLGAFAGWAGVQALRAIILPQLSVGQVDKLFSSIYIAGYFGARIFSLLFETTLTGINAFFEGILTFGSMTLYGGIIAVAGVLALFSWRKRIPLVSLGGLFVGPGLLAVGLGRIGCFLNGDDYGVPISNQLLPPWWAVQFPNLGASIYRYPVQLWESIFSLSLGFLLIGLAKRFPQHSPRLVDVGITSYTLARFGFEFFRGDERGQFFGTELSTSQGLSLCLLTFWMAFRTLDNRKAKEVRG